MTASRFIVGLLVAPLFAAGQAWAEKPVEVTVTNTPLPVTGSVNGSVSISNTPNVAVTNTASNPVPTRDTNAGVPFQSSGRESLFRDGRPLSSYSLSFLRVPQGERWIVQHVSFLVNGDISSVGIMALDKETVGGATIGSDFFIPTQTSVGNIVGRSQTMFVVEPGEWIAVRVASMQWSASATQGDLTYLISGVRAPVLP